MILIDTSVFIDIFKNKQEIISSLDTTLSLQEIGVSTITLAELELGFMRLSSKNQAGKAKLDSLIKSNELKVFPVTEEVSRQYASIQVSLLRKGQQLGQFDGLIAATALAYNLELATRDTDFKRVNGLRLFALE